MKASLLALMASLTLAGVAQANEPVKGTSEPQKVEGQAVKKESKMKHRAAKATTKEDKKGG